MMLASRWICELQGVSTRTCAVIGYKWFFFSFQRVGLMGLWRVPV